MVGLGHEGRRKRSHEGFVETPGSFSLQGVKCVVVPFQWCLQWAGLLFPYSLRETESQKGWTRPAQGQEACSAGEGSQRSRLLPIHTPHNP